MRRRTTSRRRGAPLEGPPEGRRSPPGGLPEAVFFYMYAYKYSKCASCALVYPLVDGAGWLRISPGMQFATKVALNKVH